MTNSTALRDAAQAVCDSGVLIDGGNEAVAWSLLEALREALASTDSAPPMDVRRLVIAARAIAFGHHTAKEIRELDDASEAFASRVGWEDDPNNEALAAQGGERNGKAV